MIFTIVGARPNFIKIDPLLKQTVVHTGQHYDYEMSKVFFDKLHIPKPKYNLNCRSSKIGKMMDRLRSLFQDKKPDIVIVFGDTNSSAAAALAAAYENIKVAHIEAGLRSFRFMPEEINRVVIDRISTVRFCPNNEAALNLLKEGIASGVYVVGDPSFDTMGRFLPIQNTKNRGKYLLLTLHRNFNVDNRPPLEQIFSAIQESGEKVIFPLHPRTFKNLKRFGLKIPENIQLIKPQNYQKSLSLISNSKKVITDSGGVQREAFWFSVPVIILREETEWNEIISKGAGILVGTDKTRILDAIKNFSGKLNSPPVFGANERIREIIYKYI